MKKIILNGTSLKLSEDNLTILEVLEKNGMKMNYQCREGFCGVCRCKIISGKFNYKYEPLAMAKEDEIFICIAKALSDIKLSTV